MNLEKVSEEIATVGGVQSAHAWTRVPGKERIYVELISLNGGRHWNAGRGAILEVLADGTIREPRTFAGARTATYHLHENRTIEKIRTIVETAKGR
jgi:hypothetical protein